jgi:hypothetical protein
MQLYNKEYKRSKETKEKGAKLQGLTKAPNTTTTPNRKEKNNPKEGQTSLAPNSTRRQEGTHQNITYNQQTSRSSSALTKHAIPKVPRPFVKQTRRHLQSCETPFPTQYLNVIN